MKIIPILIIALIAARPSYSQETGVFELNTMPTSINPAFTGMFNGRERASTSYGEEWNNNGGPFFSSRLSLDMPLLTGKKGSYLATGMQIKRQLQAEKIGGSFFSVSASLAYHKLFVAANDSNNGRKSELAIGVQSGYNTASLSTRHAFLDSPITPLYLRIPDILTVGVSVNYYPVNVGICFSHTAGAHLSYTVGVAGYNLNQPKDAMEKWQNNYVGFDTRYIAVAGADWKVIPEFILHPAIFFQYRDNTNDIIAGNEFQYGISKNRIFVFAGEWYHTSPHSLVITAGAEYKNLRLGASYEISYGPLDVSADETSGFLLSLGYIAGKNPKNRAMIPCSRF